MDGPAQTGGSAGIGAALQTCARLAAVGPSILPVPMRYAIAFAMVLLATVARLAIAPAESGIPYVTYFPAATLAAVIAGIGPGLVASVVGALTASYLFIPPFNQLTFQAEELISSAVFIADEVIVCSAIEAMRSYYLRYVDAVSALQEAHAAERTARMAAERANSAKSRFLAAASHDLRQPFQAMRLFHQVLLEGTSDPRQRKAVENLGAAMTAGEELLNILLDVSTLEAGNVVATVTEFPARDVLADQVVSLGPVAAEKGVALCMVPCDCTVRSDPVLLKRIVRNLAANAVRYTPPGGKVLIGCRHIGTSLRIEVWDTGCGIPADKLEQVFEDFFQLDNPERNRTKGLGLGLSIVRRTAALLGHPVTVRSWPNKGSVFAITLPATRATARPQAAGLVPASRYSGLNYELV